MLRTWFNDSPKALKFASILLAFLLLGCFWNSRMMFEPAKEEGPIRLFNRYELELGGLAEEPWVLDIATSFVGAHWDTVHIDTIPMLTIDSVCWVGNCLDRAICRRPQTELEYRTEISGSVPSFYASDPSKDLTIEKGKLSPADYIVFNPIPTGCRDRDLKVWLHARLTERTTGREIARESRPIQFRIWKSTRPVMGYP